MKGDTFIKFRAWEEVLVAYDIDMSGPGSGCSVEWWFPDFTPAQHEAFKITAEEEEAVIQLCVAAAEGREREPLEGDVPLMTAREFRGDRPLGTPLSELSGQPGKPGYAEFCRIAKSYGYD